MTTILHANWFSQGHKSLYDTRSLTVGLHQLWNINGSPLTAQTEINRTIMGNSGKFVGMIVHVTTNDSTIGTTEYQIVASRFSDAYVGEIIIGTVEIPTGETGCFYSDHTISEGARTFFRYDSLAMRSAKPTGDNSHGCTDVEFLLGLELESSSGAEDEYVDLFPP